MLRQRVITALVLVAVLLPTLLTESVIPFSLFALALATAGAWEWARLNGWQGTKAFAYAAVLPVSAGLSGIPMDLSPAPGVGWAWLTVLWIVACLLLMPQGPKGWTHLSPGLRLASGLVVMFSTWWALTTARAVGVNFLLSVMCIVWASDVAAYFAGHRWGRTKLAPSLSPGKTWEGVAGACVGVWLLALLWMLLERQFPLGSPSVFARALKDFGPTGLVLVVGALVALGVVGDLFESMIKRAVGAKDSSNLLPGHGGVLDRVDALLPVLPAAMAVLALGGR
ncbi:MAG: phosphatidate cytidylyltransferase [Betaproteobacteria bacterium]|nr:phosphatidate cytidylyltransferase [Betaproteobacteria bacterium]NBT09772.1 phosphatidate cytidylyltransferase [Betaproteobacteria bacterium]NBU49273.1 phosphatidate cytidylyltransferase [Betaproteobacteria bacterium]